MEHVLTFLALLLPLALSPGPVTITIAGLGMHAGFWRALPFFFGVLIAALAVAVLSGLGLTGILLANPVAFAAVRYAGLAYIVYLAVKFLRARPSASHPPSKPSGLFDGMLVLALNPKMYVAVTVIFSQFLNPGTSTLWHLTAGLVGVIAFSQLVWLGIGSGLRPMLRSEAALRAQCLVFGVMLLAVAAYLFLQGGGMGG